MGLAEIKFSNEEIQAAREVDIREFAIYRELQVEKFAPLMYRIVGNAIEIKGNQFHDRQNV
ncbi:hypothetical protein [Cohnella sp. GCM10012308]|uniref:hypothetical protein n=1 Tax=Cohnella sp. GCM10012308 TaxID=3317329 RepID=UPI003621713D